MPTHKTLCGLCSGGIQQAVFNDQRMAGFNDPRMAPAPKSESMAAAAFQAGFPINSRHTAHRPAAVPSTRPACGGFSCTEKAGEGSPLACWEASL